MASKAQIQTVKADFLDQSLYDDAGPFGRPAPEPGRDADRSQPCVRPRRRATAGARPARRLHRRLSRQRSRPRPASIEDVYFSCLLHDVGMAAALTTSAPASRTISGEPARDVLGACTVGYAGAHCERVSRAIVRKMGLGEGVAPPSRATTIRGPGRGTMPLAPWDGSRCHLPHCYGRRPRGDADRRRSFATARTPARAGPRARMAGNELDPVLAGRWRPWRRGMSSGLGFMTTTFLPR